MIIHLRYGAKPHVLRLWTSGSDIKVIIALKIEMLSSSIGITVYFEISQRRKPGLKKLW